MPKHKSAALYAQLAIAERLYVEEPITLTLEDLAQQTGVNLNTLKDASSRNNWVGKRDRFQQELQKKYLVTRVPEKTDELRDISSQAKRVLSLFMNKLEAELPTLKFRNAEEALRALSQAIKNVQELEAIASPEAGSSIQREVRVTHTQTLRQLIQTTPAEGVTIDATDS